MFSKSLSDALANSENVLLSFYQTNGFLTDLLEEDTEAQDKVITERYQQRSIAVVVKKCRGSCECDGSWMLWFRRSFGFSFISLILDTIAKSFILMEQRYKSIEWKTFLWSICEDENQARASGTGDDENEDTFTDALGDLIDAYLSPSSLNSVAQEFRI